MSDTEKDVIRKQAQDGMDSLIDPLLESTKELIRILKSRPTIGKTPLVFSSEP